MIAVKIKTNLIDKNRIHRGRKHNYLDLVLIENKHGRDEFGYDGFIKQGLTQAERQKETRVDLPIIGNYTVIERRVPSSSPSPAPQAESRPAPPAAPVVAEEDYPF